MKCSKAVHYQYGFTSGLDQRIAVELAVRCYHQADKIA